VHDNNKQALNEIPLLENVLNRWFLNRYSGPLIFIFILFIVFYVTFVFGSFPQRLISAGFDAIATMISDLLPSGMVSDLIANGVITGVGGVIAFLPNILILFLFISILERSGYMARAVVLMDSLMRRINLRGYSFVPLLMSFGCSVPAILAAGTIHNRRHRIITILIIPFMSCSATLPAYVLIISSCFPQYAGLVLISLYLFGILTAILVAFILNKFVAQVNDPDISIVLPAYTVPRLGDIAGDMWRKGEEYLKKISGIILIASVAIWALEYFPRNSPEVLAIKQQKYEMQKTYALQISDAEMHENHVAVESLNQAMNKRMETFDMAINSAQIRNSYIAALGHFIEPVLRPLGFEWQMGVSLLSGIAAKEILVSSLNVLYSDILAGDHTIGISPDIFTPPVAIAFMLFIFLYSPCVGALMAVRRATGKIKWMIVTFLFTTSVAWTAAFISFNVLRLIF